MENVNAGRVIQVHTVNIMMMEVLHLELFSSTLHHSFSFVPSLSAYFMVLSKLFVTLRKKKNV